MLQSWGQKTEDSFAMDSLEIFLCFFLKGVFPIHDFIKIQYEWLIYVEEQNIQVSSVYIYHSPCYTHKLKHKKYYKNPQGHFSGTHSELLFQVLASQR